MAGNSDLHKANRAKKDEFYTQLADIEAELKHYRKHFRDKVVFCNCDDPYQSNFFKYFVMNFNRLGLKRLTATCYKEPSDPLAPGEAAAPQGHACKIDITEVPDADGGAVSLTDVDDLLRNRKNTRTPLCGDGDFRSPECTELLKQADIVVTNPPFSLFRAFVAQLAAYKKQFLIIGNMNAITYKETFSLIRDNQMWLGSSIHSGDREFRVPDDYPLEATGCRVDEQGRKYIRVKGVRWFTNMDYAERHRDLALWKTYTPRDYPRYVNYDAIEVSKTSAIPNNYDGEMGVPITFLDKYNPDQFEIIGASLFLAKPIADYAPDGTYGKGGPAFYIKNGKGTYDRLYYRIVIKRRQKPRP